METNETTRAILARICVGTWDQHTLISFAIEQVAIFYKENPDAFEEDCALFSEELTSSRLAGE